MALHAARHDRARGAIRLDSSDTSRGAIEPAAAMSLKCASQCGGAVRVVTVDEVRRRVG
jgi:hypothetical protein